MSDSTGNGGSNYPPTPDFRYVALAPGASRRRVALTAAGTGIGVFGVGLGVGGGGLGVTGAAALAGGIAAWFYASRRGASAAQNGSVQAPMAIVPWGVLVFTSQGIRVLRWGGVEDVQVETFHEMDNATPIARLSRVTIVAGDARYAGWAAGRVGLERLETHLRAYADEAAGVPALDLDGDATVDDVLFEPAVEQLLDEAKRALKTGSFGQRLSLPPESYRRAGANQAADESVVALDAILRGRTERVGVADARPLAAILAAQLGATALRRPVSALSNSPHPLVAAVARAAAVKLGANVKNVGTLDEVAQFLCEPDVAQLCGWIGPPTVCQAA